jgi:hypothetical protein
MEFQPTSQDIRNYFASEITAMGGAIADEFCRPERLFVRAILPIASEVTPRDIVHGGMALRTVQGSVLIHPYVFREVCLNGTIVPQVLETRAVNLLPVVEPPFALDSVFRDIGELVRRCARPEVFAKAVKSFREARFSPVEDAMTMISMFSHWKESSIPQEVFDDILDRLEQESDKTRYGLMNAVTSVARDTQDPELRWDLEELGGGVAALSESGAPESPREAASVDPEDH